MNHVASLPWFARHELSLSWRDLYAMLSGNRQGRGKRIAMVLAIVVAGLHLLAYAVLKPAIAAGIPIDQNTLIMVSGFLLLPVSLMVSQSIESITRAFYSRSDLELILSSPAPSPKLFAIRMAATALSTTTLTLAICAPAFNVLALFDSPGWLFGHLVIISLGLLATAFGIVTTMAMFTFFGPKKTRLFSQILAAVVGASFVIGIQLVAIMSIGSMSRVAFLQSGYLASVLPDIGSMLWLPALAAMGNPESMIAFVALACGLFALVLALYADKFGAAVLKASSVDFSEPGASKKPVSFKSISTAAGLRRKEWKLLLRDKWIFSQTLMQLFYLIPPGFMLWQGYGSGGSVDIVAVPVLVMAAGQLAGGLAWLAISGEDAPELVATAPVAKGAIIRAKVEAVLASVCVVALPLIVLVSLLSIKAAMIATASIALSVVSATAIQLWFRTQARRSNFRKRQTSSRVATMAEAFSSILWAATAGLWIVGSVLAIAVAALNIAILAFVWKVSPARQD